MKQKTYNHAFDIAFCVRGSTDPEGNDVTAEMMREALELRIKELMSDGCMLEAAGAPFDTYEEN